MRKTWVYIDGEAVEKGDYKSSQHHIMPDIEPYQSMVDGSMITSRSKHREHLRKHNCFEVGNEKMERKKQDVKDTRRDVLRQQVANMTHEDANRIINKLRDDARFIRK